ncbi:YcxB family protein [Microvirga sp. W0021]|uniref:YcxB family protein n=1 Tax=Hohaiivirga grylli TaxID=3133970 RepID=A0ABV0BJL3_9HYPH
MSSPSVQTAPTASINITYIYDLACYRALQKEVQKNTQVRAIYRPLILYILVCAFTLTAAAPAIIQYLSLDEGIITNFAYIGFILASFLLLLGFGCTFFQKISSRRAYKLVYHSNRQITNQLTDQGIKTIDETQEALIKWPAIIKVTVTTDYMFLFLSGFKALIFPKQAFKVPSDFDAAVSFAQMHVSKGTHNG